MASPPAVTTSATTIAPEVKLVCQVELSFSTQLNRLYTAEVRKEGESSSSAEEWEPVGSPIRGNGGVMHVTVPSDHEAPKLPIYRMRRFNGEWVLVWRDEFEGSKLDTAKWSCEENGYGGGNNELQFYSTNPKYYAVENSLLKLAVFRDQAVSLDGKRHNYTSARLRTLHRGDWVYGRFEVRAKLPVGPGIWPAVWMLPSLNAYGPWAASGEIDIVEGRGTDAREEVLGSLHYGGTWPNNQHVSSVHHFPVKRDAPEFHIYALEWLPNVIRWFVDGTCYATVNSDGWHTAAVPKQQSGGAPFDQPFHLLLNVAVGGGFFSGPYADQLRLLQELPDSAFPQVMEVDYVRVFQWASRE